MWTTLKATLKRLNKNMTTTQLGSDVVSISPGDRETGLDDA